jgi:sulfotransferase family protein
VPRPLLIHIGYTKTATTWLQRHLFRDPATGFGWLETNGDRPGRPDRDSPVRQLVSSSALDVDTAALREDFARLIGSVEAKDLVPLISLERLSGSPFSGGHDSAEIAERLAHLFPQAKVLVVIREQASMIVSTYKQYVKVGGPVSLERFIALPRSHNLHVPWFRLGFFEYDRLLRHYSDLFGPERLLVLPYEEFVEDPAAFVAKIARFAELPLAAEQLASLPFDRTPKRSLSSAAIAVRRRLNRLAVRTEVNPAPLFEAPIAQRAVRWATRDNLVDTLVDAALPRSLHERFDSNLRRVAAAAVGDRYRESNRITAKLTGIDLSSYGWTT